MKIFISGLTAAGKTTHARLIARELGLPYFSMLSIMREVLRLPPSTVWTPAQDDRSEEVDRESDHRMIQLASAADGGVFDAWALPWLYPKRDAVAVWLESDPPSRLRKCKVAALMGGGSGLTDCAGTLPAKDAFARSRLLSLYGFDLFSDRSPFHILADNTELIPTPDFETACTGIALFHHRLMTALTSPSAQ